MAYVGGEEPSPDACFLCEAAADGAASSLVVGRTGSTVTMLNRFPYSSGHLLVVPVRHALDLVDLDDREGADLFAAVQRALRAIREALSPEGFNIGVNSGGVAGASIEHVHVHVVPRWGGDTNFMPVIADVKVLPEHLEATAAKLRATYSALDIG
jgi:ATP adenylyltransferase